MSSSLESTGHIAIAPAREFASWGGRFSCALARLIAVAGIDLLFLGVMAVMAAVLVPIVGGHIRWLQTGVFLPIAVMLILILYDFGEWLFLRLQHRDHMASAFLQQIPRILRDWVPFVLIAFIYENLHDLSGRLTHFDLAPWLYRLDAWLFGVEPTVWMQRLFSPLMTDVMSIFYGIYLALPLTLMFFLSLSDRRLAFQRISIAVAFTFAIGFVGYMLFPCLPPRFYLAEAYTNPAVLKGQFLYFYLQETWDHLSAVRGAAFPSLHVALSSVALIYAYRFRRLSRLYTVLWRVYIPLVVGLWISTVYLRHHWIPDIIAGWGLAGLSAFLSGHAIQVRRRLAARFGVAVPASL